MSVSLKCVASEMAQLRGSSSPVVDDITVVGAGAGMRSQGHMGEGAVLRPCSGPRLLKALPPLNHDHAEGQATDRVPEGPQGVDPPACVERKMMFRCLL